MFNVLYSKWLIHAEIKDRNSFSLPSKVWISLKRFSRNAQLLIAIKWRHSASNFAQIGRDVCTVRVEAHSHPSVACHCHWTDIHDTHACSITSWKLILYGVSWKSHKRFSRWCYAKERSRTYRLSRTPKILYNHCFFREPHTKRIIFLCKSWCYVQEQMGPNFD